MGGIEEIRIDEAANEIYVADNYLHGVRHPRPGTTDAQQPARGPLAADGAFREARFVIIKGTYSPFPS